MGKETGAARLRPYNQAASRKREPYIELQFDPF
jgi:hypothetical protein